MESPLIPKNFLKKTKRSFAQANREREQGSETEGDKPPQGELGGSIIRGDLQTKDGVGKCSST